MKINNKIITSSVCGSLMFSLSIQFLPEHLLYHISSSFGPVQSQYNISDIKTLERHNLLCRYSLLDICQYKTFMMEHQSTVFYTSNTSAVRFRSRVPSLASWIKLMNFLVNKPAMCENIVYYTQVTTVIAISKLKASIRRCKQSEFRNVCAFMSK